MRKPLQGMLLSISLLYSVAEAADSKLPSLEIVKQQISNISTDELQILLKQDKNLVLVDVRTDKEIQAVNGMIAAPQNINIPRGWLEFKIAEAAPDKEATVVVYCGTNQRSPLAADTLMKMGYTHVKNYKDGFFAWRKADLAVKKVDKAPNSILYSKPKKVTEGVYSAIGATAPPTYANSGHNNNLSFIVTEGGVLVMNAGDNYLLAKALHDEIKKITDQPVKYVILENAQSHAILGSSYWDEQGVPIIAHIEAVKEIKAHGEEILVRMKERNKDKAANSRLIIPTQTFTDKLSITLGKQTIEILNLGSAHSPGDTMIWLPKKKVIITGDMAFHQRLLPVFEHTDTAAWLETWQKFAALEANIVIPGHGEPTNMAEVTKYTKDYLVHMRTEIAKIIENGGELQDAYKVDQSAYAHLDTFKELAQHNAGQIFRAMEFE
jgi:glyoxylase-like metal-dependent hydrolase (beta-lactamase superfamily II)/rhodanese-related sulfurtransferase